MNNDKDDPLDFFGDPTSVTGRPNLYNFWLEFIEGAEQANPKMNRTYLAAVASTGEEAVGPVPDELRDRLKKILSPDPADGASCGEGSFPPSNITIQMADGGEFTAELQGHDLVVTDYKPGAVQPNKPIKKKRKQP